MSVLPARQWATDETSAAGRIAASEVPTATCAAWSAGEPASINPSKTTGTITIPPQ